MNNMMVNSSHKPIHHAAGSAASSPAGCLGMGAASSSEAALAVKGKGKGGRGGGGGNPAFPKFGKPAKKEKKPLLVLQFSLYN